MTAHDPVIETDSLTKDYGRRRVVADLALRVPAGTVYGFLGPNGAGKSTTIRMLLGLVKPTRGSVRLLGRDVRREGAAARRDIGAQVETPAFYGYLSGLKNLEMLARLSGPVTRSAVLAALARVRLAGRERDKVRTYSQGMRMRLGLAQALLPEPRLLVLDEPTNGLDPQGMKEVRELIRALARDDGLTVFLSSHLLGEVQQVCDRVAVIHEGSLVAEGSVDELLRPDGRYAVSLLCDEPATALRLAAEHDGVRQAELIGDRLVVRLDEDRVASLNAALVAGGVGVREIVPERTSLESFFLSVTGGEP